MLLNIFDIYADIDAISMTPSRNTRSYTLRSVPSSPGRSFFSFSPLCLSMRCKNLVQRIAGKRYISCPKELGGNWSQPYPDHTDLGANTAGLKVPQKTK